MRFLSRSPLEPHRKLILREEASPEPLDGSQSVLGARLPVAKGGISSAGRVRPEPSKLPSTRFESVETPSALNAFSMSTNVRRPRTISIGCTNVSRTRELGSVEAQVSPTFRSHTR